MAALTSALRRRRAAKDDVVDEMWWMKCVCVIGDVGKVWVVNRIDVLVSGIWFVVMLLKLVVKANVWMLKTLFGKTYLVFV